jgi:CHAD domain-containing protein
MTVSTPCDKLVRARVRQLRRVLGDVGRGDTVAIHAARTATRRLRELVPLLGLKRPVTRSLCRDLRKASRTLGRVRDADTALALVTAMLRVHGLAGPMLHRLADAIRAEAEHQRQRLTRGKVVARLEHLVSSLRDIADELESDRSSASRTLTWAVQARIARRTRVVREAVGQAGGLYNPEALHRVRIAVKKMRYAVEVALDAARSGHEAELRVLKRVQVVLGSMHDAQMLLARVRDLERAAPDGSLGAWRECARLEAFLDKRCRRLHARFIAERAALLRACATLAPASHRSRTEQRAG